MTLRPLEEDLSCSVSSAWWMKKGLEPNDVSQTPLTDVSHLSVCASMKQPQQTCCSVVMENKVVSMATKNLNGLLRNVLRKMEKEWKYYIRNFQKMFLMEVTKSEEDLQEMYSRTYGDLYLNNSQIFTDFFHELRGHLDLPRSSRPIPYPSPHLDHPHDTVDRFFKSLMWKMLTLFPDQKNLISDRFYNKYEMCVKKHMNEVKTFGDIPIKVRNDLQKCISTAQKFLHALHHGRLALNALYKIQLDDQCKRHFTRMLYCQHCDPSSSSHPPSPCQSTCHSTLTSCLQHLHLLNAKWNNYIKTLSSTYNRLRSPILNLASSLGPLSVKISEGIMNFQEKKEDIMTGLSEMCDTGRRVGRGILFRKQRTEHAETKIQTHASGQASRQRRGVRQRDRWSDNAESVSSNFLKHALLSSDLFHHIPSRFCASLNKAHRKADAPDLPGCWNATSDARPDRDEAWQEKRESEVEGVLHRLSMFDEKQRGKQGGRQGGKKKMNTTPTTTTTTTAQPPYEDDYFEEEDDDDDASGYDDDEFSAYGEDEDEDRMEASMHDKQDSIVSYNKFPNFNSNFPNNNKFPNNNNIPNNNNNFNKQPHYNHKHHGYNNNNNLKTQQQKDHLYSNNKYNAFNKDKAKFYQQYMNIVTKTPYARSHSSTLLFHPSFALLPFISSFYAKLPSLF